MSRSPLFDASIELIIDLSEGSRLSMDLSDPGNYRPNGSLGGSRFGLSSHAFPHVDMQTLTRDGALDVYWDKYWSPHRLGEIPAAYAHIVHDTLINGGLAVAWLQQSLGGCSTDGAMGDYTISRAHQVYNAGGVAGQNTVISIYLGKRLVFDAQSRDWKAAQDAWTTRCVRVGLEARDLDSQFSG